MNTALSLQHSDRPFLSAVSHHKALADFHEWETAQKTSLGNYCQISRKAFMNGADSEVAEQLSKRCIELGRDIETVLLNDQASRKGEYRKIAPITAGLPSFLTTHVIQAPSSILPWGDGRITRTSLGERRPYRPAMLHELLERVPSATLLLVPARLYDRVVADAGDKAGLTVARERFMKTDRVYALDMSTWGVAWLEPITRHDVTDEEGHKTLVRGQYTLEAFDESKNGAIFDLE